MKRLNGKLNGIITSTIIAALLLSGTAQATDITTPGNTITNIGNCTVSGNVTVATLPGACAGGGSSSHTGAIGAAAGAGVALVVILIWRHHKAVVSRGASHGKPAPVAAPVN